MGQTTKPSPPPVANAQPGNWQGATYQGMPWYLLAPANYDTQYAYPCILHLHQYQNESGQPAQADPWYNNAAFRSAHPCFVIVPKCTIGTQSSTPTFNWGGVDPNLQRPIVSALAILQSVVGGYSIDANRLYITGNSMGGLGTWGVLCNPSQRALFAAGMPVSGSCYYNIGNEAAIATALKSLPVWSCHGAKDTQVPPAFDQAVMPLVMQANPASRFTNDPNGQHDTWDTFYPNAATWNWLFAQSKAVIQPPLPTPSPDCTVVMAGSGGTIVDAGGNAWTLPAQLAVNNTTDTTTRNVTKLAFVAGKVWQQNAAGNWYSKSSPSDTWSAPTTVSPLPVAYPVPAQAAAAGFKTQTFGQTLKLGGNVFTGGIQNNYLGTDATQAADGSITIGARGGGAITSIQSATGPTAIQGVAFGGGGYFEATFSVQGGPINTSHGGWPAFWANDVEIQATGTVTSASQWPGQAAGFGHWIEIDIAEFGSAGATTTTGTAIHDWYGPVGSGLGVSTGFAYASLPNGGTIGQSHRYGFLWAPATATGKGMAQFFIDDVMVHAASWNQYNPALPPPPGYGSSAFSILDARHIYPILSAGPDNPVVCTGLRVWQVDASQNLSRTPPQTGTFRISNGVILDPDGKPFLARGINLFEDHAKDVSTSANATPLLTLFPGTNFVRVASYPRNNHPPSWYATFAAQLTAKKIVVLFEDHSGISAPPYTGADLDFECRWYAQMAAAFKDNPYVWFGTFNEPGNGTDLAGIATQEAAIYKAIRGAGSNAIILMELPSGGNPGLVGAQSRGYDGKGPMTPSVYASMTNIVWDLHQYGWGSGYSTDPAVVKAALWGSVAACSGVLAAQSIRSADGLVPVIIAEFGDSTDGAKLDVNGPLVCQTVGTSGLGFAAWVWALIGPYHDVLTSYGQLTDPYGKQIAGLIAKADASRNLSP